MLRFKGWSTPGWLPWAAALSLTAGAVAVKDIWQIGTGLEELFLVPIAVSAFLGGLWPGLAATALSAISASYFSLGPTHSFSIGAGLHEAEWILLILNGTLISGASEALHRSRRRARRAHLDNITERRAQAAALEEREQRLSGIINSAMDAIITVDDRQRIVLANPAAERIFRRSVSDLLGRPLGDLLPERHRALHQHQAGHFLSTGETSRRMDGLSPLAGLRGDGEEFPLEATISHIEVGGQYLATVILRDITARVRAEEALRASEERFRQLAENIDEVFFLTSADGRRMEYISPAWETIWGRTCAELYESPSSWMESVHELDRERVMAAAQRSDGGFQDEYRIVRPDGTIRWIRTGSFPVHDESGTVVRVAGVAEDITQRRELEAQLRHAQKLESIGQLAGGVAHDFNNWLTVISANSELALRTLPPDHEAVELIGEVRHAGERAAALTRQLLTFSRQEITEPREIDLNISVADTENVLRRLIGEDIALDTHLTAQGRVMADPGHVSQILMNLAVNARDAMPAGGRLMVDTADVVNENGLCASPAAQPVARCVRLRFADTGEGIPPDVLPRIFDPFFTTKGVGQGTGLGLAVVHGIVQQCGGRIMVSSEVGRGTVFTLLLPAVAPGRGRRVSTGGHVAIGGSETVLLVEDDDSLRLVAARALRGAGYSVIEAANGREGLRVAARHGSGIDLLLTDVVMPEMGGRELADQIQRYLPGTLVLFSSGYLDDAVVRHGVEHSAVAFLAKPYDSRSLLAKVREVLDRSASGGQGLIEVSA